VFEPLTIASTVLSDPQTAFAEIDRVLDAAVRFKRPVYIELPRDMVFAKGIAHHRPARMEHRSDPAALREALSEATAMINRARRPVILADVELHRFGLQGELLRLVEKTGIPVAATLLGKSVIGEQHPLYLGVYEGAMGREEVRRFVEASDCVVMLGVFMTDINLGIYTARLDPGRTVYITSERCSVRFHSYEEVRLDDFLRGLVDAPLRKRARARLPRVQKEKRQPRGEGPTEAITVRGLFKRLDQFLDDNTVVVADVGEALFGAVAHAYREALEVRATQPGRYVTIVVLTDGLNTGNYRIEDFRAMHQALPPDRRNIKVFPILFGEGNVEEMTELAELTGGRTFDARKHALSVVFKDIRGYQ